MRYRASAVAVLLFLALVAFWPSRAHRETAQPAEFAIARAAVLSQLRDPASAIFGSMTSGRGGAVCGSVNARNGFGGYTGPMPFAWSQATGPLFYQFEGDEGGWPERGETAERFAAIGCSIGPDQAKAVGAAEAWRESNRRILASEK